MEVAGKPVLQKPPGYRDPSVPAATAKPPPRKPQLPPALRHPGKPSRRHRTGRSCCCRFCCCLILLIVLIIVLLAAAGGFSYLWFRPHFPSFHVENVTLSVFNITSRSDGTSIDARGTVKIQATNPNAKLGLSYRATDGNVAVADKDGEVDLGTGSASGFSLGRKNSTAVRFRVAAKGVVVDDSVGARLKAEYKSKEIKFVVELRTKMGFVVNGKSTPKFSIRVKCPAVSLKQINSRRPLTKCELDFFNGGCDPSSVWVIGASKCVRIVDPIFFLILFLFFESIYLPEWPERCETSDGEEVPELWIILVCTTREMDILERFVHSRAFPSGFQAYPTISSPLLTSGQPSPSSTSPDPNKLPSTKPSSSISSHHRASLASPVSRQPVILHLPSSTEAVSSSLPSAHLPFPYSVVTFPALIYLNRTPPYTCMPVSHTISTFPL